MADQYVANGYFTVIPDLFNGDALSLNRPRSFDLMAWIENGTNGNNPHSSAAVDSVVEKSLNYLQERGCNKIGAVGYCFVCILKLLYCSVLTRRRAPSTQSVSCLKERELMPYSLLILRTYFQSWINPILTDSSSFVEESELAAICGPLSIAAAEKDQLFPKEKRHRSETILIETKQQFQINLYSGVAHGFATRCDLAKKHEKYAKEQAFFQAVTWFDEHLI